MPSLVRSLPAIALTLAAVLGIATAVKSQTPAPPAVVTGPAAWDYAVVIGRSEGSLGGFSASQRQATGSAAICYASAQGCRFETVQVSAEFPRDFDHYWALHYNQALTAAAAQLGSQGWELTNTLSPTDGNSSSTQMYFRRPQR